MFSIVQFSVQALYSKTCAKTEYIFKKDAEKGEMTKVKLLLINYIL